MNRRPFDSYTAVERTAYLKALYTHIARQAPVRVELSTGATWVLYDEYPGSLALMPDGEGTDDQSDVATVYAPHQLSRGNTGWEGRSLPVALHEPDGTVHLSEDLAPDFRGPEHLDEDVSLYLLQVKLYIEQRVLPYMAARDENLSLLDEQADRPNPHRQCADTHSVRVPASAWHWRTVAPVRSTEGCAVCYNKVPAPGSPEGLSLVDAALKRLHAEELRALSTLEAFWDETDALLAAAQPSSATESRMADLWLAIRADNGRGPHPLRQTLDSMGETGRCENCGEQTLCARCRGLG